jgi:hypothetical protein
VYALIQGDGERLHLPVFRCAPMDRDRQKPRRELAQVMEEEDTLRVLGLHGGCWGG